MASIFTTVLPNMFVFSDTSKYIEFVYDDRPTLKIEKQYEESPDIIEEKKLFYEEMTDIIPQDIRMKLKTRHVIVYVVEDCRKYYGSNPPKFILGFFASPSNRIVISIDSFEIALCHELGHAVGYVYGSIDMSKEFRAAYKKDCENELVPSFRNNVEAFAEIFSSYIHCLNTANGKNYILKSELIKKYPEMTKYMQERLGLKPINEGLVYSGINVSFWRMRQRYWNSKKIEQISIKMTNNACAPFKLKQIISCTGIDVSQSIKSIGVLS